ncbi:MAG: 23S rRNA (adenine(2503)-C(2))-methyltransferase RlmN [Chlamydiota bacterium]|nr:23S rRNA (adenine(2503)-C(2))-methyltransferase RlmN [Chlamydiota bacterium]
MTNALSLFKSNISSESKPYALDFNLPDWKSWCIDSKLPKFTATQIYQWIFKKNITNPELFTNLPLAVRKSLASGFNWDLPHIDSHLISKDTSEKFLLKTNDGHLFEMVLMPYDNRATLCISSQIGCKMGCTFCQTGKMGLARNLSSGEILSQIILANQLMIEKGMDRIVSNIVFMGMGEPLDNYDSVVKACATMIDDKGFGLSKSRVTVSTSGLIPEIRKLGRDLPVRLAISLHNADEAKRSAMMPVNRKYSLADLKEALIEYPAPSRHGITFEYVMIEGENDTIQDAKKLVKYLHGIKAKVNLIPINNFPGIEMHPSSADRIRTFQKYLSDRSIPAPVRYSRGQDVSGGCGQLAAKREEQVNMDPRVLHRERRRLARNNIVNNA